MLDFINELAKKVSKKVLLIVPFIEDNNLMQKFGLPEWYSPDGNTRLVFVGNKIRMDVKTYKNWSKFKSLYIIGPNPRSFKVKTN